MNKTKPHIRPRGFLLIGSLTEKYIVANGKATRTKWLGDNDEVELVNATTKVEHKGWLSGLFKYGTVTVTAPNKSVPFPRILGTESFVQRIQREKSRPAREAEAKRQKEMEEEQKTQEQDVWRAKIAAGFEDYALFFPHLPYTINMLALTDRITHEPKLGKTMLSLNSSPLGLIRKNTPIIQISPGIVLSSPVDGKIILLNPVIPSRTVNDDIFTEPNTTALNRDDLLVGIIPFKGEHAVDSLSFYFEILTQHIKAYMEEGKKLPHELSKINNFENRLKKEFDLFTKAKLATAPLQIVEEQLRIAHP